MEKQGGIYEYADSFQLITLYMPEKLYPGKEARNVDSLLRLIAENSDHVPDSAENNLPAFIHASIGEFMDWDNMSCNFDSPLFISWLNLIKELNSKPVPKMDPAGFYNEQNSLYKFADSFSCGGPDCRDVYGGNYVLAGFPGSEGTGSYLMKCDAELMISLYGPDNHSHFINESCTRLGILSSGPNRDGAWRFMKTFMLYAETITVSHQ